MDWRVLILCGSLVLAAGCDSPRPFAPTLIVPPPPPPTVVPPASPPSTGAAGPFGPASNPVIAAGVLIEGTVTGDDSVCFPNWDATGHCRQYDFMAASDGVIAATLTWTGPSRGLYDPEVFLAAPDGRWDYAPDAWPEKHVTIGVRGGVTYRVVVMSYGESELSFGLRVDLQP
jgi:hypothetical protein